MKIKTISVDTTNRSITKYFVLDVDGTELEISKTWFSESNSCSDEDSWICLEDEGQEFYDSLEDEDKDELEDFISELK